MKIILLVVVFVLTGNASAGQAEDAAASEQRYRDWLTINESCKANGLVSGTESYNNCVNMTPGDRKILTDSVNGVRSLCAQTGYRVDTDMYAHCVTAMLHAPTAEMREACVIDTDHPSAYVQCVTAFVSPSY